MCPILNYISTHDLNYDIISVEVKINETRFRCGSNDNGKIQLFCYHISFVHPTSQMVMDFKLLPSQSSLFDTFKNHLKEGELCEKY